MAAAPLITTGLRDLGWPTWVVSLTDGAASEVPNHVRVRLKDAGASRARRSLNLFCEVGKSQPEISASADHAVVFEGILYNAAVLAKELGVPGSRADSATLVLEAYRHWGEEFLHKLRGIFAIVLFDEGRDSLICARDAMGNHPLFFAKGDRELVVSTSLEAVVRHPRVSRELNRPAIFNGLLGYFPWLEETFYSCVRRVPPGHAMRVVAGNESVYRYWDPHPPEHSSLWITEDELGRFDELLVQAVDRSLELGTTGILLSGGLDSVSIAAVATDQSCAKGLTPPQALSLVFPHPEANEEEVQRSVAQQLGLRQDVVSFAAACGPDGFLQPALDLSRDLPLPLQNFWLVAYNHLASLGRQNGCRVILTGAGGDEWLGVSPLVAADMIRTFDLAGLAHLWLDLRRSYRRAFRHIGRSMLWGFGLRPLLRDAAVRTLQQHSPAMLAGLRRRNLRRLMPPWLVPDVRLWDELYRRAETVETDRTREPARYGHYFSEIRLALDHPLVSLEMEEVFENGRRLGTRFLQPYFDGELIELLYRVPPALLNRGGRTKGLVRETVSRRFPGLGFDRQKKIEVTSFFASLMRNEGGRAWKKMGGVKALAALDLADVRHVNSYVAKAIDSGEHHDAFYAWLIMSMESWLRVRL